MNRIIGGAETRTIDGRHFVRLLRRDDEGREWHSLAEHATAADGQPLETAGTWGELSPRQEFDRIEGALQARPLDARIPSAIHDELEQVQAAGFVASTAYLAAQAKLKPRPVVEGARFDVGATRIQHPIGLGDAAVRELIHKHQVGDFGEFGTLEGLELTDDMRWAAPAFGRAAQNSAAISEGAGLVLSRFPVEVPKFKPGGGAYREIADEPARTALMVLTLLGDGSPRTVAWLHGAVDTYLD